MAICDMSELNSLSEIIGLIYDAASGGVEWQQTLSAVEKFLGASGCHLIAWSPASNKGLLSVVSGVDEAAAALYANHYGAIDPRRIHAEKLPTGAIFRCHEYFDDDFARRNEFYCDYLAKFDTRYLSAANFMRDGAALAHFAALRSERRGPFELEDTARLDLLLPHLRQAFRLQSILESSEANRYRAKSILERFPGPAAVVDMNCRLQEHNSAMDAILRSGQVLKSTAGLLVPNRSDIKARLSAAVRMACSMAPIGQGAGARMRLGGDEDGAIWVATVWPLVSSLDHGSRLGNRILRSGALVGLTDLLRQRRLDPQLVQDLLGLTPAEAKLVACLAIGDTLNDIAERGGLSQNTVRSQLKSVFVKLQISSQGDLIRLVEGLTVG